MLVQVLNNNISTIEKNINTFDEHLFSTAITSELKIPPAKKKYKLFIFYVK